MDYFQINQACITSLENTLKLYLLLQTPRHYQFKHVYTICIIFNRYVLIYMYTKLIIQNSEDKLFMRVTNALGKKFSFNEARTSFEV